MICSICRSKIDYDITFENLFKLNHICGICSKQLIANYVVIPLDYGYICKYYYFLTENKYLDNFERRIGKEIYRIIKENKRSLVFFLNEDTIPDFLVYPFYSDIVLISIVYEDLSYYFED